MVLNIRALRVISLAMMLLLTFSVAATQPASGKSKSQKVSSRTASKRAKANKSQKSASKRGKSRSSKVAKARGSKKRGRAYAGRSRRSRWRKSVVNSRPPVHRSGIYNFLTQSWANSQLAPNQAAKENEAAARIQASTDASADSPTVETPAASSDATATSQTDATIATPAPMNSLVAAYSDSLAARGFESSNQGFIVATMDGEVLAEHNADRPFNPASVVKVATSLVAISRLGPDFRFRTSIYTDGALDPATGILRGSLYVVGSGDPAFFYENAMLVAYQLNRHGIRAIEGNLVVLGQFYFNFSDSLSASASAFRNTLTPETWGPGTRAAYSRFFAMRLAQDRADKMAQSPQAGLTPVPGMPSLTITGETITSSVVDTSNLKPLAVHTSLPLVRVLKGLNDFSNNWMARVIGRFVGGPEAVQKFLETELGLQGEELSIVTASGLGTNYISPRGTLSILRKLIAYLQKERLGIEEMLPVAGIDAGTLEKRFTDAFRGSVVGKTGTLRSVSALAGVAYTRGRGPLLFVIFNRGGSPYSFRAVQDETIKKMITLFGGPAPVRYFPNAGPQVSDRAPEAGASTAAQRMTQP